MKSIAAFLSKEQGIDGAKTVPLNFRRSYGWTPNNGSRCRKSLSNSTAAVRSPAFRAPVRFARRQHARNNRGGRQRRPTPLRAFTLVELLVVIAIIGTLAAILLPSLARGKRHTHVIVCLNNLRQIGISIENFVTDNQKFPRGLGGREVAPEFACGKPEWERIAEMTNRPLADYIAPYSQTWHCPEDKGLNFLREGPFFGPTLHYAFGCSYKLNRAPWEYTKFVPLGNLPGKPIQWLQKPATYILVFEPPALPMHKPLFAPDLCNLQVIKYPYNYFHWHFNTGPASVFDIATDGQKAISPILFGDGHSAKHDLSKALHQEPKYPTEATKDWVWYQPKIGTNGLPIPAPPAN
jgi:prepilin-type N-terminal cleavage/methylation domain-containing protein